LGGDYDHLARYGEWDETQPAPRPVGEADGMTEAMNDATLAQVTAAAPDISTWLSANAGSGKTRVLTDRVARLLLDEVPPERILCLTYTKAAAMEMQNRLFSRLGDWAMTPEDDWRRRSRRSACPARA
jgi:ATP-dependent exoDNAse (exonuclease V) beta subunit